MPEGKIYKIVCQQTGLTYYGSTSCKSLSERIKKHKYNFKAYNAGKHHYTTSCEVMKNGNYVISLVESFNYTNKKDLYDRERHYIVNFECVNKLKPNYNHTEYMKEYRKRNTPHVLTTVGYI